jgi:hypothetical protein
LGVRAQQGSLTWDRNPRSETFEVVAHNGASKGLDASRMAVAGESVGGNRPEQLDVAVADEPKST